MYIKSLQIQNFRNLADVNIAPSAGFNVLMGQNAQGKTNTVEALTLALTGKSHRETVNENFIGPSSGTTAVLIDAVLDTGAECEAKMTIGQGRSHYIDGEAIRSRSALIKTFPVVFFSPEDLSIIKDAPSVRRAFLDEAVASLYPPYAELISDYRRILKQRNTLLYDYSPSSAPLLDVYDESLVNCGADIARLRIRFLSQCEKEVSAKYRFMTDEAEDISLNYVSDVLTSPGITDIRRAFDEAIRDSRKDDILARSTTRGIHHDDIAIFISARPARKFASQGQSRSAAICLKLSLTDMIKQKRGSDAIVILDDVMSELDNKRRAKVVEMLNKNQVFITCVAQDFDTKDYEKKVFHAQNGVIA